MGASFYGKELFAGCFWPIHTWRKATRESILQRQKASMLKNMFSTTLCIKCFRNWAQWSKARCSIWEICDNHRRLTLLRKQQRSLLFWRRYCAKTKRVREMWLRKGMRRFKDKNLDLLWRALLVWRYWRLLIQIVKVSDKI